FQRDLPWRRSRDPYRVWISEIMLQQTRVAAVIPYYERFLERFPSVHALAVAQEEEVLRFWSGLGYYSRARNLREAAQQIVAKHGGEFPRAQADVLDLSGIGEYSAAAILSIAFGQELAVLDGNVARVIARLDAIRGDLRAPVRWRALRKRAEELLAGKAAGDWNQAVMELGATLCTPRSPRCLLCPVARFCESQKLGIADELPEKRKKRAGVSVRLAAAVLLDWRGNSLLLPPPRALEENAGGDLVPPLVAKLWHFPMAPANGDGLAALRRLFALRFKMKPSGAPDCQPLAKVRHSVTYRRIEVQPYLIHIEDLPRSSGGKVIALNAVLDQAISNLTRKLARAALKHLAGGGLAGPRLSIGPVSAGPPGGMLG
ncbi:MAG TPA: A/G-specific adenine glycosylase, partial [Candidatus Acidoferrum sp.]|nr:A/G-specific adenine glycosylase [Candidatus Acidoferrum sp.]